MSTIKFEQAVFLSENKSEIEEVKTAFREIACKVMSNTLVQITNFELIERVIEAGEFVHNDDITPTFLKLIQRVMEDAKEYLENEKFKKCEEATRTLSSLISKTYKTK